MIDWTDAFDNSSYVPGSDGLPDLWAARAQAYREAVLAEGVAELGLAYGPGARNRFDLFRPASGPAHGLVVFVHGGYWQWMDRSLFSHLAEGARSQGWAVAMPSYSLAPEARVSRIVREVASAIATAAEHVAGPVRIAGHSAGGHLVSRMACADTPLPAAVAARLARVLSISGIHDLRPLLLTEMNAALHLDAGEAEAESPALHAPRVGLPVRFHVGAKERPELLRQTRLIAEAWGLKGGDVADAYLPGEDHFSIVEGLSDAASGLVRALLD
ncbi:alpha/beta hydrolase [Roseibacterium sp. SDUM158016]|uniref:alpha/beta hydrolase n=1 Tax=Roseicyclus sediminis TaxID=2980997 RepID=UPI0021D04BA2|nr:alpha/beta hydrolase [Roseibacterium sp. SDUM158016]MCU4654011.1 alpha/beta hydrolase [Roseibacterium sp. SDUM158016]